MIMIRQSCGNSVCGSSGSRILRLKPIGSNGIPQARRADEIEQIETEPTLH